MIVLLSGSSIKLTPEAQMGGNAYVIIDRINALIYEIDFEVYKCSNF